MPCYKRKLSKGEFWYYKFDHNGQTHHSKAIYPTKQAAKRAEAECMAHARDEELGRPNMTVRQLCIERLDHLEATRSPDHYKDNKTVLKRFSDEFGRYKVREITKKMINDYLNAMSQRLKKANKDNFVVNKHLRNLKSMFFFAVDVLEVIDRNPVRGIKPFSITKRKKYIPPDEHLDLVYGQLNEDQKKLFIFVKETGCRISESLRAKAEDIGDKITLWTRKTRHGNLASHLVPSTEPLEALKLPTEGRLFPLWTEYPRFLEDACEALKIRKFGWHALRHRKASLLCESGKSLVYIKEFLGHSSAVTTSIYLQAIGYDMATEKGETDKK